MFISYLVQNTVDQSPYRSGRCLKNRGDLGGAETKLCLSTCFVLMGKSTFPMVILKSDKCQKAHAPFPTVLVTLVFELPDRNWGADHQTCF